MSDDTDGRPWPDGGYLPEFADPEVDDFDRIIDWYRELFDRFPDLDRVEWLVVCPACGAEVGVPCRCGQRNALLDATTSLAFGLTDPWPRHDRVQLVLETMARTKGDPLAQVAKAGDIVAKAMAARNRAIVDAADAGYPLRDIGDALGVTSEAIRKIVRAAGH